MYLYSYRLEVCHNIYTHFTPAHGQSVGKDEKVATLERQLQKAMSLIQEQSAHVEELTLQVEELKAKIEPEVSYLNS